MADSSHNQVKDSHKGESRQLSGKTVPVRAQVALSVRHWNLVHASCNCFQWLRLNVETFSFNLNLWIKKLKLNFFTFWSFTLLPLYFLSFKTPNLMKLDFTRFNDNGDPTSWICQAKQFLSFKISKMKKKFHWLNTISKGKLSCGINCFGWRPIPHLKTSQLSRKACTWDTKTCMLHEEGIGLGPVLWSIECNTDMTLFRHMSASYPVQYSFP